MSLAAAFVSSLTAPDEQVSKACYASYMAWMCDGSQSPEEWNNDVNNALGLWTGIVKYMPSFDVGELNGVPDRAGLVRYIHKMYMEYGQVSWYYDKWFSQRFPPSC